MPKRLEVRIGPHRTQTELAHVNDNTRPTVIDSELFVGRVLVKIRDFQGLAEDGEEPKASHAYFEGRNRKFDIQIEGRFKSRPGVAPYRGDEVQFGSDFDKFVSFPTLPFKAGFRVARTIDPNVHYDFEPPSGRPYIMSPYLACMNTFCAWPSPARYGDALVCLFGPPLPEGVISRARSESVQNIVPVEQSRQLKKFWHFIGLRGDPRIDALVEKNKHLMAEDNVQKQRPLPRHQISFGTREGRDQQADLSHRRAHADLVSGLKQSSAPAPSSTISSLSPKKGTSRFSAITSKFSGLKLSPNPAESSERPNRRSSIDGNSDDDDLGPLPIDRTDSYPIVNDVPELKDLSRGDLTFASTLHLPDVDASDPIEKQLGPWRFASESAEQTEDNTFVMLDHTEPVARRRKHFSKIDTLKQFQFDPDVVYGASFFTPFCDFNTFDLAIGPVHMNIGRYFTEMPVRYTLRSTRLVPGAKDEECFVTISFQLVDVP